jgi:ketosteroid isomerase-like protein
MLELDLGEAISGAEAFPDSDPRSALSAFYRAFNGRNLDAMSNVWLAGDEPSMSNPVGGIARGWGAIRSVYARLFSSDAQIEVQFHDYSIHDVGSGFIAVGRERGHFTRAGTRLQIAFRTTRCFRRDGAGWRQLHHHGSADNPAMLDAYQAAVQQ